MMAKINKFLKISEFKNLKMITETYYKYVLQHNLKGIWCISSGLFFTFLLNTDIFILLYNME
jgi:hypothetical protein